MITVALNINAAALTKLLQPVMPAGVRVEFFLDPALKIGIHAKGHYIKAKLALGAQDGALVADLKDVKINGVSIGGPVWEHYIPPGQYGPVTMNHHDGSMRLVWPGVHFKGAGVHDSQLTIIAEVTG